MSSWTSSGSSGSTRPPISPILLHGPTCWRWGLSALLASVVITATYHFAFTEFRSPALIAPVIGNAIITLSDLATGSPIAVVLSHAVMHGAAVFHGMATTVQLPPHC